jgi:hypothetical protein
MPFQDMISQEEMILFRQKIRQAETDNLKVGLGIKKRMFRATELLIRIIGLSNKRKSNT